MGCSSIQSGLFSCLLHEFFPAAGTGDGDFSLSSGDPDHLAAFWAVEVAVLPVLHTARQLQEFPVFLIPLVGIPGQATENGPDHQAVAQGPEDQVEGLH